VASAARMDCRAGTVRAVGRAGADTCDGFDGLDPSHPLGGRDGGQDATCTKNSLRWTMAVYFPRGQQDFAAIQTKFKSDLGAARAAGAEGIAFVTNQEMRLAERRSLIAEWPDRVELFHLERVTAILDSPAMSDVRRQFLGIDTSRDLAGQGGTGGSGTIVGNRGTVIGGRGGVGGTGGKGGDGGSGFIQGDDGVIVGGDGGNAGTPDGRGGRGARSPFERTDQPTSMWRYGKGGSGANAPEYNRRLLVLASIRQEYRDAFPEEGAFIDAGVDPIPLNWVNKRLEERGEVWRVEMGDAGYILPPLEGN
jgi:hypothetical protein